MDESDAFISKSLIALLVEQFELRLNSFHGIKHWARVLENGRYLASNNGSVLQVVELFSIFHDSRRIKEGFDLDHGKRGLRICPSWAGRP